MLGDRRDRSGSDGGRKLEVAARGWRVREPYESIGRKRCWSVSASELVPMMTDCLWKPGRLMLCFE